MSTEISSMRPSTSGGCISTDKAQRKPDAPEAEAPALSGGTDGPGSLGNPSDALRAKEGGSFSPINTQTMRVLDTRRVLAANVSLPLAAARREVLNLMDSDSCKRFLESEQGKQFAPTDSPKPTVAGRVHAWLRSTFSKAGKFFFQVFSSSAGRPRAPEPQATAAATPRRSKIELVLQCQDSRSAFKEHVKREFSPENLDFVEACEKYDEAVKNGEDATALLDDIMKTYVNDGADSQINISYIQRTNLIEAYKSSKSVPEPKR